MTTITTITTSTTVTITTRPPEEDEMELDLWHMLGDQRCLGANCRDPAAPHAPCIYVYVYMNVYMYSICVCIYIYIYMCYIISCRQKEGKCS